MQHGHQTSLSKDFLASIVVFLVALPLCMGIAIASGFPPTAGIVTGIVGGIMVGAFSGSPLTVSGPAAGLVVLVAEMLHTFGAGLLSLIIFLAGLVQLAAGAMNWGNWFRAISPAVIHGMLAGIGILIIGSQFHIMLDLPPMVSGLDNLMDIPGAVYAILTNQEGSVSAALIGFLTIVSIILWTRFAPAKLKMIPGALVGVVVAMLVANSFDLRMKFVSDLFAEPAHISTLFEFSLPSWEEIQEALDGNLIIAVISLAFIASAESLLSVTAVDKMHKGPRAKYNKELLAQGLGNSICGILGALPMTGVIVRSSANVQAGATSRISTILHGIWLLLFVWLLLFSFDYIPVATLAAVLVFTGYKLAFTKAAKELMVFGKAEVAIYAATILSIVIFDLLTGVVTGLLLSIAKLLYIFSHLEIAVEESGKDGRMVLHLRGAATFIALPKLAAALEDIAPGRQILVQFDDLEFMDHACIELIDHWHKQYAATGGQVDINWDTAVSKYHSRNRR